MPKYPDDPLLAEAEALLNSLENEKPSAPEKEPIPVTSEIETSSDSFSLISEGSVVSTGHFLTAPH